MGHIGALLVEDSRRPRNNNKIYSGKGHVVLDHENQEWVRLEDEYNMCGLRKTVIASLVPHIYIHCFVKEVI